jgi:hypothetical protein
VHHFSSGQIVLAGVFILVVVGLALAYLSTVTDFAVVLMFIATGIIIIGGGIWMQRSQRGE